MRDFYDVARFFRQNEVGRRACIETPQGRRLLCYGDLTATGRYLHFVEAWVRVRGGTPAARHKARERFLAPLLRHLDDAGVGHISEIADGDAPHRPNGCPFQAWSVGEALRLDRVILR